MQLLLFLFFTGFSFYCSLLAKPFEFSSIDPVYIDQELESVWLSLEDIYHPTYEDYKKIEDYLMHGRREYLDGLINFIISNNYWGYYEELNLEKPKEVDRSIIAHKRILQQLKFVDCKGEKPEFRKIIIGNVSPDDTSCCILLYSSKNEAPCPRAFKAIDSQISYDEKALKVIKELQEVGYKGHVLYWVGGYPLLEYGGIKLSHVPYSFKVLAFIQASLLGYDNVLWLDSSIHPTNNLKTVFNIIEKQGSFLMWSGVNFDYEYKVPLIPLESVLKASLTPDDLNYIPHIIAGICGLSFAHSEIHSLVKEWLYLTRLVEPAMTMYPEQFLLSVACYRSNIKPTGHIGNFLNVRSLQPTYEKESNKPFWLDKG